MERITYTPKDFDWIGWDAATMERVVDELLAKKKKSYDAVKYIPASERTFENTIVAIERSNDAVSPSAHAIHILAETNPEERIRTAAKKALDRFQQAMVDVEYDEDMYRAVQEFAAKGQVLAGVDKKLFDDMALEYRRMGFDLPPADRERLKRNLKELAEQSSEFTKNANEFREWIEVSETDLAPLPGTYRQSLERTPDGRYKVSTDEPEFLPFMRNCPNAEKRRELNEKDLHTGGERYVEILKRVIELRRENTALLGYPTFVDYRAEVRMAKNASTVERFLADLAERSQPAFEEDFAALRSLKREMTGDPAATLAHHDVFYYTNELKKRRANVDDEEVREYFPLDAVLKGMFEIYGKLFGVSFSGRTGWPAWHPDVKFYAVQNAEGGEMGYFFLDLFPRPGKHAGAMCAELVSSHRVPGDPKPDRYQAPLAVIVANVAKPLADIPSLLSHQEVRTLFHEFGHAMHDLLAETAYASQAGSSVAWDFVEAPSQMLENWVWEKETLRMMSRHYRTGDPLPDEIAENLGRTRQFLIGYQTMRQIVLSRFDLLLHTAVVVGNPSKEYASLTLRHLHIALPETQRFPAGFAHLMHGYDAGYYSYLWAHVYAADMFTRFRAEGLLNPQTGRDYRAWILAKGSSEKEIDLVRGFLGREPSSEAFLKELGL